MFSGNKVMQSWRMWHLLTSRVVERCDRSLKKNTNLDLVDLYTLSALSDARDERLRMSELASAVGFSPPRMTYRVNKLVRRGYVTREAADDDARSQQVRLAEDGRREMNIAAEIHRIQINEIFGGIFTDEELDRFIAIAGSQLALRLS